LVEILIDPNNRAKWAVLAKVSPYSPTAQRMLGALLAQSAKQQQDN
jgi:hypothetical protein